MDFKLNCDFSVTPEGYLDPVVYATDLTWGETSFHHTDWYFELLLDSWAKFVMVIIHNAIYFLGSYIFTGMLEAPLTAVLHNYDLPMHLGSAYAG
jgi:hypothetical protein